MLKIYLSCRGLTITIIMFVNQQNSILGEKPWSSINAEGLLLRGCGFEPLLRRLFFVPFIWIKVRTNIVQNSKPGTFVRAVILQMGGWILRNGWLIKPSSMVQNEMRACQLTKKALQKNLIVLCNVKRSKIAGLDCLLLIGKIRSI